MENGNPLAALSGAKQPRIILGAKDSTVLISGREFAACIPKYEPVEPTPLFQYSTIPSFQRGGYWQTVSKPVIPRSLQQVQQHAFNPELYPL